MEVNFKYHKAEPVQPIRIEQVFAEKPGGGIVAAPVFDAPATTAVGFDNGKLKLIKAYRLYEAVTSTDTTMKLIKGSGVEKGDVLATAKVGVACTAVDKTNEEYDLVTAKIGVNLEANHCLYQAKAASADAAEPLLVPSYVIGNDIVGNEGDKSVRLINGANLRKETANIADEVAVLLPMINLV